MAARIPHSTKEKEEPQICSDCGDVQDAPVPTVQADAEETPVDAVAAAAHEPLPSDVKRSLIALTALAVFACLFSFIMSRANSPDKAISTFFDSIAAQDLKAFSSIVVSDRDDFELTEESVAAFLALHHDRTALLEQYQETLRSDLAALKKGEPSPGNGTIRLVKLDRVLHKAYRVELSGVDILFSSNLDNTLVEAGGKTAMLETAGTEYPLRLLPGLYDITATHTSDVLGKTFSTELNDCELVHNCASLPLELAHGAVTLGDIGWDVASLTVNGAAVGPVEFDAVGEFCLAPLPEEAEIAVSYNVGGVTLCDTFIHSGECSSEYFYPQPSLSQADAQAALDQVGASVREALDAYGDADLAALAAMPAYGDSTVLNALYDELQASLALDSPFRYVYHYTLREMEGDLHWEQDYSYDALTFRTMIFLGLDYTYERYYNTELQTNLIGEFPLVYQKDCLLSVCIQRIDGQWVLSDLDWTYFNNRSSIQTPYVM